MAQDTITTDKTLVDPEQTQASLIALRDELARRASHASPELEWLMKINSCLYRKYP